MNTFPAASSIPVLPADFPDAHHVTLTIAQAFHPMDICQWLVSDPQERARVLYAVFGIYVDHAMQHGQVWMTGRHAGTAVWFIRDGLPTHAIEDYDHRLKLACGPHLERFRILDDEFDKRHPTEPHQHLAFLATNPFRQSVGLGTTLLNHHHDALDRAGIAAYLEASNERNRGLYQRHGYVDHGPPIQLPDGPCLWPMWREPQPVSGDGVEDEPPDDADEDEIRP